MATKTSQTRPWFLLIFPPVLFLLVITAFSIYFGVQFQGDADAIATQTTAATPYILLVSQLILLVVQFIVFRRQHLSLRGLGWQVTEDQTVGKELLLGAIIGAPIGIAWIFVLEPILSVLQGIADYVPAGSLFPALSGVIIPFAIADVVLAPFVEENIYRGYGWKLLLARFGKTGAVLLSSLFFGLLHWSGGFWYIVMTATLVGVPFAILRNQRGNILAPFGAHLALNIVETALVVLR
jgi:membrane protease YdiL (CAAX protease family)